MFPRDLSNQEVKCPACGRDLEIFSDEQQIRCPCGATVRRQSGPAQADASPEE